MDDEKGLLPSGEPFFVWDGENSSTSGHCVLNAIVPLTMCLNRVKDPYRQLIATEVDPWKELTLENLTKRFGTLTAVDRVNWKLWRRIHLFLGPSDAGRRGAGDDYRVRDGDDGKVIFEGSHQRSHPQKREFGHRFPVLRALPDMTVEETCLRLKSEMLRNG